MERYKIHDGLTVGISKAVLLLWLILIVIVCPLPFDDLLILLRIDWWTSVGK